MELEGVPLQVTYRTLQVPKAYRMDLVVNDVLVLELKTVERLGRTHEAQLFTDLRFPGNRVGLYIKLLVLALEGWRDQASRLYPVVLRHLSPSATSA